MKLILEVNNKTRYKFPKKTFEAVFETTLKNSGLNLPVTGEFELSVALVAPAEIQELNLKYRKKDSVTDVLSFGEFEKTAEITGENIFLGELILCPAYIEKNAKEDEESLAYAMDYIVSHGILHLLGFTHGKKMFSIQKKVADIFLAK